MSGKSDLCSLSVKFSQHSLMIGGCDEQRDSQSNSAGSFSVCRHDRLLRTCRRLVLNSKFKEAVPAAGGPPERRIKTTHMREVLPGM